MPRPKKCRKVCTLPDNDRFGPLAGAGSEVVVMTVDEYEAIRLIDWEGLTQQACSAQMQVSRATVQSIYDGARRKLADCLINGKQLHIGGGDYRLCGGHQNGCCHKPCRRCRAESCAPYGDPQSSEGAEEE